MAGCEKSTEIDHYKKELIVFLLREALMNRAFPQSLGDKLQKIVSHWDYRVYTEVNAKCLHADEEYKPLGTTFSPPILDPAEKKALQLELEKSIIKDYPLTLETFERITRAELTDHLSKPPRSPSDDLLPCQNKLVKLCTKYYERLEEMQSLSAEMCKSMRELLDMRFGACARQTATRAEVYSLRSQLVEIEAKIVNVQLKRFVYDGKNKIQEYMEYYKRMNETLQTYRKQVVEYKKSLKIYDD